jgi:hypothetical protein
MMLNRSWAFSERTRCLVHDRLCPVHPSHRVQESRAPPKKRRLHQVPSIPSSSSPAPLFMHTSGMTCTPWSASGLREGYANSSEIPNSVYVAERAHFAEEGLEDCFFCECTEHFPVEVKLVGPLASTHEIRWIITGPEFMGWPCKRPRMFGFGMNIKRLVWVGPSGDSYRDDFAMKFYRMTQLSGDDLFCASEHEVHTFHSKLARAQGHFIDPEVIATMSMETLLPYLVSAGYYQIFLEHIRDKDKKESLGGVYIGDIHQHPGIGATAGPDFPVQLQHGLVTSFRDNGRKARIATGLEHIGAHGFHLFPSTTKDYPLSRMLPLLQRLPDNDLKSLSGNGMHVAAISTWLFYCLSNVAPVV